ncbi:MAG: aminopeptidase P family protein [Acidimicrobiia bacterium]|nr:aminopeptidase P family protein [Acidimicrobiia bacterium]
MTDHRLTAPMSPLNVAGRPAALRSRLEAVCRLLLVTKPANLRWLTGFTASNMAAAITPHSLVVATDRRYSEALGQHLEGAGIEAELRVGRDVVNLVLDAVLPDGELSTVGLEAHHITWQQQQAVADRLDPGVSLVATDGLIERARLTKERGELDRLRRAAAIADHALATVMADLPSEVTERQIARRLEEVMVDAGADEAAFPTIVAAGPNSARPHAVPSDRGLAAGDLLVIDIGARVDGYGSDMTRTFTVGSFTDQTEVLYEAVAQAQRVGVAAVAPGVAAKAVDAACRDYLEARGLGEEFTHGTGHGIGLEIHESPFLSSSNEDDVLAEAQVVTVEPGVYRPGVGGVRVEDSVVVTAEGCQPITLSPKDPLLIR